MASTSSSTTPVSILDYINNDLSLHGAFRVLHVEVYNPPTPVLDEYDRPYKTCSKSHYTTFKDAFKRYSKLVEYHLEGVDSDCDDLDEAVLIQTFMHPDNTTNPHWVTVQLSTRINKVLEVQHWNRTKVPAGYNNPDFVDSGNGVA